MKIRFLTALGFCLLATLFVAFYPSQNVQLDNDDPDYAKEAFVIRGVMAALDRLHYEPVELNNETSERAFESYIKKLDGGKRFLTKVDLARLEPYRYRLDDDYKLQNFDFFDLSLALISEAIAKPESWYNEVLDQPFDFDVEEEYTFDPDNIEYAEDDEALQDYWRQLLKYEVLSKLHSKIQEQEKNDTLEVIKTFDQLEQDARDEVRDNFEKWFKRLSQYRRSDRFNDYVNTLTELYDPHTNYFDPKDKENFDISMSNRLEGIGARLQADGEFVKVESVVPGGPAWKQKQLEPNDQILKVAQEGEDRVDIRGMRLDDVVEQVRGKKGTKVTLTVKKADGSEVDITIVRDEVILDEGKAKSAIVRHPEIIDNIGYIRLPRFYADFERKDGNSCSKDIAIELEKLKEKNVNGIILDLRNNGGGSLRDVIDMSGLFIESGPIVQVKARDQGVTVLEDKDSDVQYSGPLIVMVNQFSASASEILAAALQDYDRAIIVGSNATYGKGTVQRFYPLDRLIRVDSRYKPLGDIKLTMQKFYRIDGGSTQLNGVSPDIVLPDPYMYIDIGERETDYPMAWSEIDALNYSQNVFKVKNKDVLVQQSADRVQTNETFMLIEENAKRLKESRNTKTFPLAYDDFEGMMKERERKAEKFKSLLEDEIPGFEAHNLPEDLAAIKMDESKEARNDAWIESIKKDVYLLECLSIMNDMMQSL